MVSADQHDGAPLPRHALHGTEKHFLRIGGRHERIEYVSRHKDEIDITRLTDAHDFVKRRNLFGQALAIHEPLADMPVGSVKNVHKKKITVKK